MLFNASFYVINDFVAFDLIKYQCKTRLKEKKKKLFTGIIDKNYDKNHLFLLRKLSQCVLAIIMTQGNLVLRLQD